MSGDGVLLLLILGMFLLYAGMILHSNYKNRKLFLYQAEQNWGKTPDVSYTADQMERISVYGRQACCREEFYIDEITWKDLDMDRVFQQMNHTVSAPGEEYLMYLLRTPRLEENVLKKRDRLSQWFAEQKEQRCSLQMTLSGVSKDRRYSIGEELQFLKKASSISVHKHQLLCASAVICLLVMLFQPVCGFFLFLAAACVNVADYYGGRDRKASALCLGCFKSVLQMMDTAGKVEKYQWEELGEYCQSMGLARRNLKRFHRSSHWLFGICSASGSLEAVFADWLRMIFHLDLIWYNKMLREIQEHEEDARVLLECLGGLDCAIAAASIREMLPVWCRPVFRREMRIQAENLYHPLLRNPVPGSFQLEGSMLLTGSNASGKSTFLKSAALNAILAQTIFTCPAVSYQAPLCRIITSMALSDNLERGESYFMAEIKSLKRILEAVGKEGALLCMVDEVLRGTNTVERIAASSEILKSLCQKQVFCFAATHDIELTYLLEDCYKNYHFDEEISGRDISFSYELKKGRAVSKNAIRLLSVMGYEEKIVTAAQETAREYERTGVWKK